MGEEGSIVVFDRSPISLRYLASVIDQEPRFARAVADWLNGGELPYLLLGTTGGTTAMQFALSGRDTAHLLSEVLEEAATHLAVDVNGVGVATAVDEALNELVAAAWSEILSVRSPRPWGISHLRASYTRTQPVDLSTRS
jgi:hypothetical protein